MNSLKKILPEIQLLYRKLFYLVLITIISFLTLSSCSDSPTDLGTNLLSGDLIDVISFNSAQDSTTQRSYSFKKVIPLGSSSTILIGKNDNFTAHSLISYTFILPDSLREAIRNDSINVISSKVDMTFDYLYGDESANFDYSVYKITDKWSSSTFSADTFSTLQFETTDLSSNRTEGDSLYSFDIQPAILKDWLRNYVDTSFAENNGILISPTASTNKIIGFIAFSPELSNDTKIEVVIEKPGAYIDTITAFVLSDVSVVLGDETTPSERMLVRSSVVYNSFLAYDLSSVPDKAIINSARLTIKIDTLATKVGSNFANSLRVFLVTDSIKNEADEDLAATLLRKDDTYTGDFTSFVRFWLYNNANQGIIIKSGNELRGVEKFILYGSDAADINNRPKLDIVYTVKK